MLDFLGSLGDSSIVHYQKKSVYLDYVEIEYKIGHEIRITASESNMVEYDFIVQDISNDLIILVNASLLLLGKLCGPTWDII